MPKVYDANTGEGAIPVIVLGSDGNISGAGGDATSANQTTEITHLSTLAGASTTIDTAIGGSDRGFRVLYRRDDVLTTLTPADGDAVMGVVDEYGRMYDNPAAISYATDGVYIGGNASGGTDALINLDIDESEDDVKTSAGKLYGFTITNLHTATVYLKFFNATAANTTVGSTAPKLVYAIPASSGLTKDLTAGIDFTTAICVAAMLGVSNADATAIPSPNLVVGTIDYK